MDALITKCLLMVLVVVWFLFEVSEIKEHNSTHDQSLVFLSSIGREVASEVISFREHSLSTSWASLLKSGQDFTRRRLDVEIDSLTALKRTLTVHTDLHAAAFNDVLQVVVLVVDLIDDVAACPRVLDLSDVLVLAIFDIRDEHFGSVQAGISALAWSVNEQEWFVVEFFIVVLEVDLDLERLAVRGEALLGAEAGFFLGLEELLSLLFTILAQWEDIVGVVLVTTGEGLHKVELLLDEDTISSSKSVETLLELGSSGLGWLSILLRRILRGILLRRILLRRVLLGILLLGRVLLGRVLLRRILLWGILLGRVLLLLWGIAASELNSDVWLLTHECT
jgi:hypothetical protein